MKRKYNEFNQANESISKFKLLTSYGGPGSLMHTSYGSVIISCIEEWGFIQTVMSLIKRSQKQKDIDEERYVVQEASFEEIYLSGDRRLLEKLKEIKNLINLKYLTLIPDVEIKEHKNVIKSGRAEVAVNSSFMPKGFFAFNGQYKLYKDWYDMWNDQKTFFPPQYKISKKEGEKTGNHVNLLKQDNLTLICTKGHISDIPWAKYLRWRSENPYSIKENVNLFGLQDCCSDPDIQIKETSANASGFDGKWIKCNNTGCNFAKGASLKGIISTKIICPGHKPWEAHTGSPKGYFGDQKSRNSSPPSEPCVNRELKVVLTTGNNLYFSRSISSIYMPDELFLDNITLQIKDFQAKLENAMAVKDFLLCIKINDEIEKLKLQLGEIRKPVINEDSEISYRYQEYIALKEKNEIEINIQPDDLFVKNVTGNLNENLRKYFTRLLRIDNLKLTSAQLDFSRVEPISAESNGIDIKNIFRSKPEEVITYPVVENFGEGIFIVFNNELIDNFSADLLRFQTLMDKERDRFADSAVALAKAKNWQLYLIHTFCHLLMRELEFRCGYPTASLSERLYVSNDVSTKMYGFMIYTSEGAEGSMGGLIAQTREENINVLISSALKRATVCNSDPLCWQSEGQGLFELNLASCFSCSLVSETSCEHRNIYLDRRVLLDETFGFFRNEL